MTDSTLNYRPGLTHLRALSVTLVLLFHAGVVESGYIGVDVFFVLSGFLISSILWDGLSSDQHSGAVLAKFYARRCLRILPLSILVLMVTAVASHFFFKTLIDNWVTSGRASLVWVQNWFLIHESNDYFASEGTNPFQQYWSLGVEEQFYVMLPLLMGLLLFIVKPFKEHTKLLALGVVATLGVAAAVASYKIFSMSESEFYYSTFTRSYQLLTGVAIMAFCRRFDLKTDRRWLFALGVAGLAVVGLVLHLSLIQTGFWATLFAGMCVYSSKAVLVDNRWLERLGFWSYGIYLWHFPISIYLTNERPGHSPWLVFALTFAASTALAAFTFNFFENPVRHLKVPKAATFAGTGAVIAVCWIALGLLGTPAPPKVYVDQPGQSDARSALPLTADGKVDLTSIAPKGRLKAADVTRIEGWMPLDGTSVGACGLRNTKAQCIDLDGSPKVMLLGDSFANRIYQALRPLAEENQWGLSSFVRPGCPWMDDVYNNVGNDISERCARDKHLMHDVVRDVKPDAVVIHSYPYREANDKMTRVSTGEKLSPEEVADAADETIDWFTDQGIKVVFVEPTPFAADSSNADDCLKLSTWADDCNFEPIDVNSPLDQAMRARAEDDPDVSFVSINDLFCTDQECQAALGELAVMGDQTHVSGGLWVKLRSLLLAPIQEATGTG